MGLEVCWAKQEDVGDAYSIAPYGWSYLGLRSCSLWSDKEMRIPDWYGNLHEQSIGVKIGILMQKIAGIPETSEFSGVKIPGILEQKHKDVFS